MEIKLHPHNQLLVAMAAREIERNLSGEGSEELVEFTAQLSAFWWDSDANDLTPGEIGSLVQLVLESTYAPGDQAIH